ncbi:alpha-galactosidase [Parenemella sanctibonifatiensis]|uniref:Alpha-galactosidase n=1 Tax=Parenemella sanctibonifatiensis TaxID=2016505 RepID=A0A255EMW7_9ACTN|nr:alpha-galactosidase [Parenemella sanctibonifatiensis]OYN90802.1 alpha-galactosidase [Parenemella sanctibonifatiensis]
MSGSMTPRPTFVSLQHADLAVVLAVLPDQLPIVLHWGAPLAEVDATELWAATEPPVLGNEPDRQRRVSVLPESWTGWIGTPGLAGSRAGAGWSPKWQLRQITVDGTEVSADLTRQGPARVVVDAVDPDAELAVAVHVELLEGGLLRLAAELTNTGADGYQLDRIVLALPVPRRATEIADFGGRWLQERTPQRLPFAQGSHWRENRRGRTGGDAAYLLQAGTAGFDSRAGEVWAIHTGWSGGHIHAAERQYTGERLLYGGEGLLPGEIVLAAGQRHRSPWLYAAYGHGTDEVAHHFHSWLRSRPEHPVRPRPVTFNNWEATYFEHDLATMVELIDRGKQIGAERFVLDDGWFGGRRSPQAGLGDWTVSPEVWPEGLTPLIEAVHAAGMEFGLWVEPEMVNPDSDLARAHPDWILQVPGRQPIPSRHQQVLNLAEPGAYAHVRDQLVTLLEQYPIAYLKWDHNRDLVDAGAGPAGRGGVHAQTRAAYHLMAELKQRFPGLEIESCSSGGGRVDLGVMEHADRVWASDNIDPLERLEIMSGSVGLLPFELLGSHVAAERNHSTDRRHSVRFRAQSALFGHVGVEWDLREASDEDLTELAGWIRIHKEIRELCHHGRLVRGADRGDCLDVQGVVSQDQSQAVFRVARTDLTAYSRPGAVELPGLASQLRYRVEVLSPEPVAGRFSPVWARDRGTVTLSGAELDQVGLEVGALLPESAIVVQLTAV